MRIPIRNIGKGGIIKDSPAFDLQPNQFTDGVNVVFRDGSVQKSRGWAEKIDQVGAGATDDAYWFHSWKDTDGQVYVVFGLDGDIRLYDGNLPTTAPAHDAITASHTNWQMDQFGKFPVINNQFDPPQYASSTDGSVFAAFPDFAASLPASKARVVRPFKAFMVALFVGDDPYTVYWSDESDPATFPTDWDYTSPSNLAGRNQLPASDGQLVDCRQLGDANIVYTDFAAYAMRLVSNTTYVFGFTRLFRHGLLNRDSVVPFQNKHFCIGNQVIYVHDGSQITRVADHKVENTFFTEATDFTKVYATKDEINHEIMVYYNSNSTYANRLMRWDWIDGTWTFEDIDDGDMEVSCFLPAVRAVESTTWSELSGRAWGSLTETWAQLSGIADDILVPHRLSLDVNTGGSKYWETETTYQRDGSDYDAYLTRDYIDLDEVSGDASVGVWHINGVYPQVSGNGTVNFRVGATNDPNSAPTWGPIVTLDMDAGDYKVDVRLSGRYLFWQFGEWEGSPTTNSWEFSGMDIEADRRGRR